MRVFSSCFFHSRAGSLAYQAVLKDSGTSLHCSQQAVFANVIVVDLVHGRGMCSPAAAA